MMVPSLASGTAATTTAETKAAAELTSLSWRKLMRIRAFSRVRLEISGSSFSKFSGATTAARGTGLKASQSYYFSLPLFISKIYVIW
ncbi:unnamed protein product [Prunus armeniaca]|uniref:Uncharacterized protein n=1 Tax=Prunus armeniaca TaxID=36596 RepID=A0A6J5UX67_PRUAR|nr:unnamed protein product [Prunus armeniaca]CAB4310641.1 unnamed protein product [Prunus armeniaca]